MGVRFARHKPRHLLAPLLYKLDRFFPASPQRKLDLLLDLEWIANRLAHENAVKIGLANGRRNVFLLDRIDPTDRVLDLGCGTGAVSGSISATQVVGVDHDEASIRVARREHPGRTFVVGDAREYLQSAEPFQVLVLSHILEHLDDPGTFLLGIAQNFERIYFEVPDFEWSNNNLLREKRGRSLIYTDNDHVSEFDRDELEELFAAAGLSVSDAEFRGGVMRYWLTPDRLVPGQRPIA
ncbi:MAG TPA: class I SAM-dependent methyltransferase [Sphingomicrobium sp.]|nr:class I SAM-dependent methyltransferase [Sphingomicrobium sp.]